MIKSGLCPSSMTLKFGHICENLLSRNEKQYFLFIIYLIIFFYQMANVLYLKFVNYKIY